MTRAEGLMLGRTEVMAALGDWVIDALNFDVLHQRTPGAEPERRAVRPEHFRRVAEAIRTDRIALDLPPHPHLDDHGNVVDGADTMSFARYEPGRDTLVVPEFFEHLTPTGATAEQRKALLLHECVHAYGDMASLSILAVHDEAAAYIAQIAFQIAHGWPRGSPSVLGEPAGLARVWNAALPAVDIIAQAPAGSVAVIPVEVTRTLVTELLGTHIYHVSTDCYAYHGLSRS